jgi:3-methylcrotonyl-CoA carboxylase alpha subunit
METADIQNVGAYGIRPMFKKILVANRGEIAMRIIRAIRKLGASPVAVYSTTDHNALHVQYADEAYCIGPAPAAQSYLNIEAILDAATRAGVEAIHPGYGFLAENATFAQAVRERGLVFIGPPAEVIALMGDKIAAKRLMSENNVPVIPGYMGEDQSVQTMLDRAAEIGYPVVLKAAAGGGGKGMRVVTTAEQLPEALESAQREAMATFGDSTIFLEKLLIAPRHIEVQILADTQGHIIYLGERECSIQRRHQKVIEEAPSPIMIAEERCGRTQNMLHPALRAAMGDAAVRAAHAAGYVNAGTVEFLVTSDASSTSKDDVCFYFLEMNTRIQVEHPVTEMVTGIDLVAAQIEIAAGRPLQIAQQDVTLHGHAIECRLYAEDPDNGFLPQSGRLTRFRLPRRTHARSPSVLRSEVGVFEGEEITPYYDPLLAKIIAYGADRSAAIHHLRTALAQMVVEGVKTNLDFLKWVLDVPAFQTGETTTAFVEQYWRPGKARRTIPPEIPLGAVAHDLGRPTVTASASRCSVDTRAQELQKMQSVYPFLACPGWRVGEQGIRLAYEIAGERYELRASKVKGDSWRIELDDKQYDEVTFDWGDAQTAIVHIGPRIHCFRFTPASSSTPWWLLDRFGIQYGEGRAKKYYEVRRISLLDQFSTRNSRPLSPPSPRASVGARLLSTLEGEWLEMRNRNLAPTSRVVAPMPGTIVKLNVREGDYVQSHQALAVMEAMKMEHVLEAPHAGRVASIKYHVGDMVPGGALVIELEGES